MQPDWSQNNQWIGSYGNVTRTTWSDFSSAPAMPRRRLGSASPRGLSVRAKHWPRSSPLPISNGFRGRSVLSRSPSICSLPEKTPLRLLTDYPHVHSRHPLSQNALHVRSTGRARTACGPVAARAALSLEDLKLLAAHYRRRAFH